MKIVRPVAALNIFPFIELKVDRQFVIGCAHDRLKQVVCRGNLDLAHGHGVRTTAKGVQSRADFRTVHEMGFDQVQGFLFGKKFAQAALVPSPLIPPR
jgi:EAL domain-containing protein (putative c-di-GMP-specific phosphodiesterase class I)